MIVDYITACLTWKLPHTQGSCVYCTGVQISWFLCHFAFEWVYVCVPCTQVEQEWVWCLTSNGEGSLVVLGARSLRKSLKGRDCIQSSQVFPTSLTSGTYSWGFYVVWMSHYLVADTAVEFLRCGSANPFADPLLAGHRGWQGHSAGPKTRTT